MFVVENVLRLFWIAISIWIFALFFSVSCHSEQPIQSQINQNESSEQVLTLAGQGKLIFERSGCNECHSIVRIRGRAPYLNGLYGKKRIFEDNSEQIADENYIRRSIQYPSVEVVQGFTSVMPSFKNALNEEEIQALIEYIKSLK